MKYGWQRWKTTTAALLSLIFWLHGHIRNQKSLWELFTQDGTDQPHWLMDYNDLKPSKFVISKCRKYRKFWICMYIRSFEKETYLLTYWYFGQGIMKCWIIKGILAKMSYIIGYLWCMGLVRGCILPQVELHHVSAVSTKRKSEGGLWFPVLCVILDHRFP